MLPPIFQDFSKESWCFLKEVGPPCQNILRYLSLLSLSGFIGDCSGYLRSLGKWDQLLKKFFETKNLSKKKGGERRVSEGRSSWILMKLGNLKLGPIFPILSKYTPLNQTKFTKLNLINQAKCVRCEDPNILNQIYQSKSIQWNLQIKSPQHNLPNQI